MPCCRGPVAERFTVILLGLLAAGSLVVALVAWSQARRTAKRLEQVSQMYWELKYQHGELRVQVQRATGAMPPADAAPVPPAAARDSFIPLASLKG
jgi:hypothetical protein